MGLKVRVIDAESGAGGHRFGRGLERMPHYTDAEPTMLEPGNEDFEGHPFRAKYRVAEEPGDLVGHSFSKL
jgi:hypothetical protein